MPLLLMTARARKWWASHNENNAKSLEEHYDDGPIRSANAISGLD